MERSKSLFEKAKALIPGGVNSPVRAFNSVGGNPLFIKRADGPYVFDEDGKGYIDYVGSWGPMILGHNNGRIREAVISAAEKGLSYGAPTEGEVVLAEKMTSLVPGLEMVRMVNSGTEAVMSVLRLARGFTGRDKIIKFEGCYHGHSDSMLVKAGSGAISLPMPNSLGVTAGASQDTLIASYNNAGSVEELLKSEETACVIIEPVAANMGVVPPKAGFLKSLRELCSRYGTLLIFDEVITGFRLGKGGAAEFYGIKPDLYAYGKIIGGGMPVGAYGGRRDIMEYVAPCGPVYQAGTLSGNPIAMAAGIAQLDQLEDGVYRHMEEMGKSLEAGLANLIRGYNLRAALNRVGSLICLYFGIEKVDSYDEAKRADTEAYGRYFRGMLARGVYLAPAQFEAMFLSYAHGPEEIEKTLNAAEDVLKNMKGCRES